MTQIADLGNTVDADVKIGGWKAIDAANMRYNNLAPHLAPSAAAAAAADNAGFASSGPKKP